MDLGSTVPSARIGLSQPAGGGAAFAHDKQLPRAANAPCHCAPRSTGSFAGVVVPTFVVTIITLMIAEISLTSTGLRNGEKLVASNRLSGQVRLSLGPDQTRLSSD